MVVMELVEEDRIGNLAAGADAGSTASRFIFLIPPDLNCTPAGRELNWYIFLIGRAAAMPPGRVR